jgi:hypothetical protein
MANPLNGVPGWRDFADDAELLAHLLGDDSRRIAADRDHASVPDRHMGDWIMGHEQ